MNPGIGAYPRAERLDAEKMARALFEQTGIRLSVEGPCAGGEVGPRMCAGPTATDPC